MRIKTFVTDLENQVYWHAEERETLPGYHEMNSICLYPAFRDQTFSGFGGAFTEAAAYTWNALSPRLKDQLMDDYFSLDGLGYRWGRVPMNSCDFSLGHYCCVDDPNDAELRSFQIQRDQSVIIPMIRAAEKKCGTPIHLMLSPWSPPAFMKSNNDMRHGGRLLPRFRNMWAACMARYVREYQENGFDVFFLSVQNEPNARQSWESCLYSAEEEGIFAANHLAPALHREGLDAVKILIWDHNKDLLLERVQNSLSVPGAVNVVAGAAFHWYSGDHFDAVRLLHESYPEKQLIFSEGCVEYSRFEENSNVQKAEMYAHDILGNLNAGTHLCLDWNLLLDAEGGPNHVGNFCEAPIMCTTDGALEKKGSYYYIGHFSRWIRSGATRIGTSSWTDRLETTAFQNTDGSTAVVILNRSDARQEAFLRLPQNECCPLSVAEHSIMTVTF